MQYGGLQDGFHTADDGVKRRDEHQSDCRNPKEVDAPQLLNAEHLLEDQTAGVDRHGDLRHHVTDERNHRQNGARLRVVTPLQELGHRQDHAAGVKRHEDPTQQQNHPPLNLPMGHRHTRRSAGTGKADQMLRPDVRSEQRRTDGNPCRIATAEKVVRRIFILLTQDRHHDPNHHAHEQRNDNPI